MRKKGDQSSSVELGRYKSAADIPSFVELNNQIKGFKVLRFFLNGEQKTSLADLELQLEEMTSTIDGFYDLFGERNWVLHDCLYAEEVRNLVKNKFNIEEAERELIAIYNNSEFLHFALLPANQFDAMRKRMDLIEKAKEDYFSERYYSCVMILLAVIDGFVNELESEHKGFHARQSTEFSDWGIVTVHHKGIERVHKKVYRKTVSVTKEEPVYDLYRNGIMHGTVINFNNIVVATKAWNLLFSILDWARAKRDGEKEQEKTEPTLPELLSRLAEHKQRMAEFEKNRSKWKAFSISSEDKEFAADATVIACRQFLDYWKGKNYGKMADFLPNMMLSKGSTLPKCVRDEYDSFRLEDYELTRVESTAPVLATITLTLCVNNCEEEVELGWIYESRTNDLALPASDDGEWHINKWETNWFMSKEMLTTSR